ncbi:hypothetical protein N7509_001275 [Penicillium cosmopolitanum]|uniref:Uncharacterized protein n=1 Tax=Penicillium cosmopolitanum TaxID=1131564 RepID=A0A9X0BF06_9EURO|nr:uncharacterized protein N7509_001275 [Penicillium cosmopolitanum]KAJ5414648.1 hypothetical protein N7509_001275 [Penicillium cosmopolitanum]
MSNPKDSMKSTWRTDKTQWGIPHKILNHANVFHEDLTRPIPVHAKTDKLPHLPDWQSHRWILIHASIPLAIHQLWLHFTNTPFHPIIAFIFYYQASRFFAFRQLRSMRELGHQYGYLDGDKHARDGVPDVGVGKTLLSIFQIPSYHSFNIQSDFSSKYHYTALQSTSGSTGITD